jgi:outer membrane protein OmpA-like peptidoglycan-associated protein
MDRRSLSSERSRTESYNQRSSERRATAVKEYLTKKGLIAPNRLSTIGYGETRPAEYEAAPKDLHSEAAKANMKVLFEIIVQSEHEARGLERRFELIRPLVFETR